MWQESCSHMLENSGLDGLALFQTHTHTVDNVSWRSTCISEHLKTALTQLVLIGNTQQELSAESVCMFQQSGKPHVRSFSSVRPKHTHSNAVSMEENTCLNDWLMTSKRVLGTINFYLVHTLSHQRIIAPHWSTLLALTLSLLKDLHCRCSCLLRRA